MFIALLAVAALSPAMATIACGTVEASKPSVEVDMRNVDLHITRQIELQVRHLRGRFLPLGARPAPYLDDPSSYTVTVDTGEVAVDLPSLNAIVSRALERARSNVHRVEISVDDKGQLRQKGVVKKGINVPFDMRASVGVTPEGSPSDSLRVRERIRHTSEPAAQAAARADRRSHSCRSRSWHHCPRQRLAARHL
jgi:hypothetical protein